MNPTHHLSAVKHRFAKAENAEKYTVDQRSACDGTVLKMVVTAHRGEETADSEPSRPYIIPESPGMLIAGLVLLAGLAWWRKR